MKYSIIVLLSIVLFSFTIKENQKGVKIIIPGTQLFSEEEIDSYAYVKEGDWYGLCEENGTLKLEKTTLDIYETYIECWDQHVHLIGGSGIIALQGEAFTERKIPNLPLDKEKLAIHPDSSFSFIWNGKTYKLRAEAELAGAEVEGEMHSWNHFKNYKLYLSDGEKEQMFFTQSHFLGSKSEILFLGDIDNDGELDILMSDPSDYEMVSIALYLSSIAEEDEIVGYAGGGGYSTDC